MGTKELSVKRLNFLDLLSPIYSNSWHLVRGWDTCEARPDLLGKGW
jgi:hypothetical protein